MTARECWELFVKTGAPLFYVLYRKLSTWEQLEKSAWAGSREDGRPV